MNAWGVIVIAIGVGVIWWAIKRTGSLSSLISELGTAAAVGVAAKAAASGGGGGPAPAESGSPSGTVTETPPADVAPVPVSEWGPLPELGQVVSEVAP